MLNSIKTKEQLLLSVLITSLLAFIVGYIIGGWKIGGALSAICLLILLVAKNIWFSDKSNFLLRLSVVNIAVVVVGLTNSWLQPILLNLAKRFLPDLSIPDLNTSPVLYLFVLILVFIVFYFTQDRTVLGKEKETIIEIIQEPDFKDRFKMVCESLADDIRRVDKDTNWRGQYYTPLEAEVEFQDLNRRKKKIVKDLLAALKETKERLILVLGDPGAGKSVALRKLCLGLLTSKEVLKSYKIPIYINLKEWNSDREWTEDTPPTVDEIKGFVLENLKNRDIVTRDFFEDHFDKMYENGNLFFVFDSFDEIPAILGTSHDSLLIDEVSYVFTKFLKGARQPKAQGIIASREFRKPSDSFQSTLSLLIRPLSETNIISIFNRYGKINNEKVKELFRERPDLSNHARNPFTAALISEYIYRNQGSLPENLFLVYDSYVAGILNTSCREKMQRYKLQSDDIKNFMIDFGKVLFENSSLEIPINELRKQLSRHNFEEIVEILKFSRLCREGQGIDRVLSFSHRRFCEFFSVCNLLKEEKLNDKLMLDIPTDSLWRDTLVLYCMVAPRDKAIKIADFCWQIIDKSGSLLDQKSIHALRFLVDAFRGRKECIENFNKNLTKYILKNINKKNIFTTKFAVEALSLLDQDKIDEGTTHALSFGNNWIFETALRGSRHLSSISKDLKIQMIKRFRVNNSSFFSLTEDILRTPKDDLLFSLSLSEAFWEVKLAVKWKFVKHKIALYLFILCAIIITYKFHLFITDVFPNLYNTFIFPAFILIFFMALGSWFILIFFILDLVVCMFLNFVYFILFIRNKYIVYITGWSRELIFYLVLGIGFFIGLGKFAFFLFSILAEKFPTPDVTYVLLFFMALLLLLLIISLILDYKGTLHQIGYMFNFREKIINSHTYLFLRNFYCYRNVDYSKMSKREYIQDCFINTYPHYSSKLLDYLVSVHRVLKKRYPANYRYFCKIKCELAA